MTFIPTDIAGLQLWLKADAIVGLSDGDRITSWPDSSGQGNDAAGAPDYEGNSAIYKTNQVNGLPAAQFAPNNHLTSDVSPTMKPFSIFAVLKPTDFSSDQCHFVYADAGGGIAYRLNFSTGKQELDKRATAAVGISSTGATLNAYQRVAVTYSGTGDYVFYLEGSPDGSGTNDLTFTTATHTMIGSNGNGTLIGFLPEILIYDSVLSSGDRGDVDDYLYNKYFVESPSYDDAPSGTVVLSGTRSESYSTPAPPTPAFGYTPRVRENPPLRLHILAHTPNGNTFRWGEDERRPENNYEGLSFATTIPGGFETMDCTLPRKTRLNYQDLTRLSTLTVKGAGERVAGEYRLEKTPRSSGTGDRSIKPQAVGWQAHLDDDTEAAEVYVDRDLQNWGSMSGARRITHHVTNSFALVEDGSVEPDTSTGIPSLLLKFNAANNQSAIVEALYDAGPARIASIYYDFTAHNDSASFVGYIGVGDTDAIGASEQTADLIDAANDAATGTFSPTARYRYAYANFGVGAGAGHGDDDDHWMMQRRLTVWGNHGLTKQGTAPNDGLYASDVIANALSRWCPLLRFTTGSDGTIRPTSFIIPQLEFRSFTTVSDILTQANRFHLRDWAVWEGQRDGEPTFYYNERNGRGKRWRARVSPSNLQETGPQVDRLWNGIIVSYQDVDGTTKTVGPTGCLADATDPSLLDTDPLNPVNQLGIKRYATLDMGIVSTSAGATEVGRQFLVRSKELDQSGSADLVGYVTDDHGVMHPSWAVRAGDQISFVDASDPSYRRVVHTNYDHDARSNSVDLDSPPEGMDALLEELGASLYFGTPPPSDFSGGPMTVTSTANVSF